MENHNKSDNVFSELYQNNEQKRTENSRVKLTNHGTIIFSMIISAFFIPVGVILSVYYYHNNRKLMKYVLVTTIFSSTIFWTILIIILFNP